MSTANISLAEIIRRKRGFVIEELEAAEPEDFGNDPFDDLTYEEFKASQKGEIRAYDEMLDDIDVLSEELFFEKYDELADDYQDRVRTGRGLDGENVIDFATGADLVDLKKYELMGFCRGVDEVLYLFEPVDYLTEYD